MIEDTFDWFEKRLSRFGLVVIAGGAVRDSLMGRQPKDFDVFVLHDGRTKFKELKESISAQLTDLETVVSDIEWHKSEPYLVASVIWRNQEVQVMANPAPCLSALVMGFDWNVCLFGYERDRYFHGEDTNNIGPGKELKLNKVTYPLSTLRRGFRFSERFLMRLRDEDLSLLCGKVKENVDKRRVTANEPDMPSLAANALPE